MMKTLKVLLVTMVLALGVMFFVPTVSAETTTAVTTESETVEVYEFDWQELKYKIQLGIIGFLSSATFGTIAGVIINQLKKKALEKVNEAVDSNQISQDTANKATQFIEDNYVFLKNQVDELQTKVQELLDERSQTDERVNVLLDKYEEKDQAISEIVEEYLGDEEDD